MYQIGMSKEFECPKCKTKEFRTLLSIQGYIRKWQRPGGYVHSEKACYPCILKRNKRYRKSKLTPNTYSRARPYVKTPKGHVVVKYASIRQRCLGIDRKNPHIYEGLPFLGKKEFYDWALNHPEFLRLYEAYKKSGYRRRLAPSLDRIDSTKGYTLGNMQWVPNYENAARSMRQRWVKFKAGDKKTFGRNKNIPN